MQRLKHTLRLVLWVHGVAGAVVLGLVLVSPPMVLGAGRIEQLETSLETFDFKWYVAALALAVWLVPLLFAMSWRRASAAGLELERIRQLVEDALRDRAIPVQVDVQGRVPVRFDEPLRIPVELHTRMELDEEVDIETEMPVRAEIPVDAEVETSVLRFGTLKIPIRAVIPVDMVLPVKGRVRVKTSVPVNLQEEAVVQMPPIDVPVSSRLETRIDLLTNLRQAEELLRRKRLEKRASPAVEPEAS